MSTIMTTEAFTLSDEKAADIAFTFPCDLNIQTVREFCCADWPNADEHQAWLDTASPEEIADWVRAGVQGSREG